jgi:hypothetical protein
LKHRKPDWKLIEGKVNGSYGLELIEQKILEMVDFVKQNEYQKDNR